MTMAHYRSVFIAGSDFTASVVVVGVVAIVGGVVGGFAAVVVGGVVTIVGASGVVVGVVSVVVVVAASACFRFPMSLAFSAAFSSDW